MAFFTGRQDLGCGFYSPQVVLRLCTRLQFDLWLFMPRDHSTRSRNTALDCSHADLSASGLVGPFPCQVRNPTCCTPTPWTMSATNTCQSSASIGTTG